MENKIKEIPVHSNLVMYEKPRYGIIEGFFFEIHGMLLSESLEPSEYSGTVYRNLHRTVLEGDSLDPWIIEKDERDAICFLKSAPNLTVNDFWTVISRTYEEDTNSVLRDLNKYGFTVEKPEKPVEVDVYLEEENLLVFSCNYFRIKCDRHWIPGDIKDLYYLQDYLGCDFIFRKKEGEEVENSVLELISQIMSNRKRYGTRGRFYSREKSYLNDGVFTYYQTGLIKEMSREEFCKENPDSYEI